MELVNKFGNDIIMIDALYQWASNPTSFTAAQRRNCPPSHGLIKNNIKKRYNLDSERAEETYKRLKKEIESENINFNTGYLELENYIKNEINNKYGEVLRNKTIERIYKASKNEKYVAWLYLELKEKFGLFPYSNGDYFRTCMDNFGALFFATFNFLPTISPISVLEGIGFINELQWISSKDCMKIRNEYIFPGYLEPIALEKDKYFELPDMPNYKRYMDALLDDKIIGALIFLDELLHQGCVNFTDKIYGEILPTPYIIGMCGQSVGINPRIYDHFKEFFFNRKVEKVVQIGDRFEEGLANLCDKYYPNISPTEAEFKFLTGSRIWLVGSYAKFLAEKDTIIVVTPWITGEELKWLRNQSKTFVVLVLTFMGIPDLQKMFKDVFLELLDKSNVNWGIIDLSRENEVHEMIVNNRPKLFDELIAIAKGGEFPAIEPPKQPVEEQFEYDVFISHASEDKEPFVRELAETLTSRGLRVWYDEFTLLLGDSLRQSIDHGLARSRYGVVVLSKNFFEKNWPKKELEGLVARENSLDKVILPIWHGVTKEQVKFYSLILADRLAVSTDNGTDYVVKQILKVFRTKNNVGNKKTL